MFAKIDVDTVENEPPNVSMQRGLPNKSCARHLNAKTVRKHVNHTVMVKVSWHRDVGWSVHSCSDSQFQMASHGFLFSTDNSCWSNMVLSCWISCGVDHTWASVEMRVTYLLKDRLLQLSPFKSRRTVGGDGRAPLILSDFI